MSFSTRYDRVYYQRIKYVIFRRHCRTQKCMICGKQPVEGIYLETCFLYFCSDCEARVREEAWQHRGYRKRVPGRTPSGTPERYLPEPYSRPRRIKRYQAWANLGLSSSSAKALAQPKRPALEKQQPSLEKQHQPKLLIEDKDA